MRTTGVAELKARLSSYLAQVKGGRELLITERGVPVARLVPLDLAEKRGARRDRLARAGTLRLGRGRARRRLLTSPKGKLVGAAVLRALLAERDEQR